MIQCDRDTTNLAKSQAGFIQFVVQPAFQASLLVQKCIVTVLFCWLIVVSGNGKCFSRRGCYLSSCPWRKPKVLGITARCWTMLMSWRFEAQAAGSDFSIGPSQKGTPIPIHMRQAVPEAWNSKWCWHSAIFEMFMTSAVQHMVANLSIRTIERRYIHVHSWW